MIKIISYILAFILTFYGVEYFRRWSLRKNILDIPNERSSHRTPIPRGGGLIIVCVSLIFFLIYQIVYANSFVWSYLFGGLIISIVSWFDDLYDLSIFWRFLTHMIGAITVVLQMGALTYIYVPLIGEINLGFYGVFLTVLWVVWFTNAFNFMDGIDGISAVQSLSASMGWSLVGWFWGIDFFLYYGLIIFCATLGFLFHNWHPARVFMGDVGSAFLGYSFAVMPLLAENALENSQISKYLPFVTIIFLWLFVFDSFYTLIKRIIKKEKIWKAHRQHLYQILIKNKYPHNKVAGIYGLLSFVLMISTIIFIVLNKYLFIMYVVTIAATILLVFIVFGGKLLTKETQNATF